MMTTTIEQPTTATSDFRTNVRRAVAEMVRGLPDDDLLAFTYEPIVAALTSTGNGALAFALAPLPGRVAGQLPAPGHGRRRAQRSVRVPARDIVRKCVLDSGGISMGEVIDRTGMPKSTVANLLKRLREDKQIFREGSSIHSRYAGDKKTAAAAAKKAATG